MMQDPAGPSEEIEQLFKPFATQLDDAYGEWVEAGHAMRVARGNSERLRADSTDFFRTLIEGLDDETMHWSQLCRTGRELFGANIPESWEEAPVTGQGEREE